MRISKERHDSNIRVSKLEVAISQAILDAGIEFTHLEVILALQNQGSWWINTARNAECPLLEKEGDESNT